jgi:hypothetical protein
MKSFILLSLSLRCDTCQVTEASPVACDIWPVSGHFSALCWSMEMYVAPGKVQSFGDMHDFKDDTSMTVHVTL